MAAVDSAFIGQRIAQEREARGLTQADLGALVDLDRTAIAKIETGTRKVSATELVALANHLDRRIEWFVTDPPQTVLSRRSDPDVGERSEMLDRRIEQLARDVEFLVDEAILPGPQFEAITMPGSLEEAEVAADETRRQLDVGHEPLLGLQDHAEQLGLLAFSLDIGEGGDAAYVSLDRWGVALINGALDPGRRRFNLAHELGHHLFGDAYAPEALIAPGDSAERLINAFAVHLLLPRLGLRDLFEQHSDVRAAAVDIAVEFRASWTAVCSQLKNLGLVSESERSDLSSNPPTRADFVELGKHWVAEMEPPSTPTQYGQRVIAAYRAGKLTSARTAELLWGTVTEQELPQRHSVPLDGLRREFEPISQ